MAGGKLLLELNRVLRPGGFFVWSATPVYQKKTEDVEIWKGCKKRYPSYIIALEHVFSHLMLATFAAMSELIKKMCWELVSINKDTINGVGVATYRKPTSNECYTNRSEPQPPICADSDDPNASWYISFSIVLILCLKNQPVYVYKYMFCRMVFVGKCRFKHACTPRQKTKRSVDLSGPSNGQRD